MSTVKFPRVVPCTAPGNHGKNCLLAEVAGFNFRPTGWTYFAYHEYRYATHSGHPYYVTGIGEWAVSFEYPIGTLNIKSGFLDREAGKEYVKGVVNK